MSDKKPLVVVDGARLDIDGYEILAFIVPTEWESEAQMRTFQEQFYKFGFETVLVSRQPDGTLRVAGSGSFLEAVRSKIASGLQWTKIPIYPPDSV